MWEELLSSRVQVALSVRDYRPILCHGYCCWVCVCVKRIHDSGRRRSASLLSSGSTLTSVSEPCGRQTSASSLAVVVAAVHMGRHTHTTRREA